MPAENICPWCGAPGPSAPPLECRYCHYHWSLTEAAAVLDPSVAPFVADPIDDVVKRLRDGVGEVSYVYFHPFLPDKKLRNVRATHDEHLPAEEPVAAILDDTLLGSATEGLVVTPNRICWKTTLEPIRMVPWRSVDPTQVRVDDDSHFMLMGARIHTGYERRLPEAFVTFIQEMANAARRELGAPTPESFREAKDFVFTWNDGNVLERLRHHIGHRDDIFFAPSIPDKKLATARSAYGQALGTHEPVLVLVDNTLFGSAADNVLITTQAIYGRSSTLSPARLPWVEVDPSAVRVDGDLLQVGSSTIEGPRGFSTSLKLAIEELAPLARRAFGAR